MELVAKPDYSFVSPSTPLQGAKLCFLSRQLGLSPGTEDEHGYPSPPLHHEVQRIASHFPVTPKRMIFMNQVHGDEIINKTNHRLSFPTADALITAEPDLALCVKSADCVPLFLFDPKKKVAAAVHAGWRGTALKIVKKTLLKMEHFYKTDVNDVLAFVGPAVGPCCYEVGSEVHEAFHFLGKRRQDYFGRLRTGRFMMDIKGVNACIAAQAGVPEEQIDVSDLCTRCRADLFHSYRRDGAAAGRNVSFITLGR